MNERMKILERLQSGIITPEEADELLQTLNCYGDNEDGDKETLENLREKLVNLYKKVEGIEKRASEKISNTEAYKNIEKEFSSLKAGINSTISTIQKKLDKMYNKTVKENFHDFGNSLKKFCGKIASVFSEKKNTKNEKENDIIEIEEVKNQDDKDEEKNN